MPVPAFHPLSTHRLRSVASAAGFSISPTTVFGLRRRCLTITRASRTLVSRVDYGMTLEEGAEGGNFE